VKDPKERAETKTRVATELKDNKKFEDWKENSWQPYFNLAADGKASRTCVMTHEGGVVSCLVVVVCF